MNIKPILSHLAKDPDFGELVELYVDEMPERIEAIRQCHLTENVDELTRLIHQLKGAAGSYGFDELSELAKSVEQGLKTAATPDEILAQVDFIVECCERVRFG